MRIRIGEKTRRKGETIMSEPIGIYTKIVEILRDYGQIPIDLLAFKLERRRDEILDDMRRLEMDGIIEIDGEQVNLSGQKKQRWWRMKS
jgi:DNA-binding Lrp family transcriptional regulator